jgi:hypothetical protein
MPKDEADAKEMPASQYYQLLGAARCLRGKILYLFQLGILGSFHFI